MLDFKNYRDASKENWGTKEENLTLEQINTGCLMRIADASEKMATNYIKLENDYKYMKERRDYYEKKYNEAQRKISALKGVITKIKKQKI